MTHSITSAGLINPITVRVESDKYFLVAGLRRLKALKQNGHTTIPALITDKPPLDVSLIENVVRQDLTVIQKAESINRAVENTGSSSKVSKMLGVSSQSVSDYTTIASLPKELRDKARNIDKCTVHGLRKIALIKDTAEQTIKFDAYITGLVDKESKTDTKTLDDRNDPQKEKMGVPCYVDIEKNKIERFKSSFAKKADKWSEEDKKAIIEAGIECVRYIVDTIKRLDPESDIEKEAAYLITPELVKTVREAVENKGIADAIN